MARDCILAADLGGSGTKSMLYDLSGQVLATAFRESRLYHPEPDATTADPEEMFLSAIEGMRECVESGLVSPSEVRAIVLDGQQTGMMWVDEEGKALGPYDHWLDTRASVMIPEMLRKAGERILEKSGTDINIFQGAKVYWWKQKHPEIFAKACKMTMPGNYVGGRLAGLKGAQTYYEDTTLGYDGLADIEKCEWDAEICGALGIPLEKLPRIVSPTTIVGKLTKQYADYLGLPAGVPIVSGAGDFPASGVGAGICRAGQTGDIAGTASIFFACVDKWRPDPTGTIRINKSPIPGLWYLFVLHGGGGCLRWYRDAFFAREKAEGVDVYSYLNEKAAKIGPGSDGLAFYPFIGGRFQPPSAEIGGAWAGIQWAHTSGHFYRAMLEAVAYEYKRFADETRKVMGLPPFNDTRVFGGGSAGDVWNQIKADVLGLPYITLENQECTLLGSAVIAGCAIGVYKDMVAASQAVNKQRKRFEPKAADHATYERKVAQYSAMLRKHEEMLHGIQ